MSVLILHLNGVDYELAPSSGGSAQADTDFRNGMKSGEPFAVDVMIEHDRQDRMVVFPANVFAWLVYVTGSRESFQPLSPSQTSRW